MKVLIIGASGQLGTDLCRVFGDVQVVPLDHRDIEITDINSIRKAVSPQRPDVIINTAAFIRVDDCEGEQDKAFSVNALGAGNVAAVSRETDAQLVSISTDYVFGGGNETRNTPYSEFDTPLPPNVYGQSKLAGERLVSHLCPKYYIVRTSGLFGTAGASGKGGNFVETILKLSAVREELNVVNDQVFSPTYSPDLAVKIRQVVETGQYGIWHITNSGCCSWYEFSRAIAGLSNSRVKINAVTSEQYPQKARRPHYSVLKNYHLQLAGIEPARPWGEALGEYMEKRSKLKA